MVDWETMMPAENLHERMPVGEVELVMNGARMDSRSQCSAHDRTHCDATRTQEGRGSKRIAGYLLEPVSNMPTSIKQTYFLYRLYSQTTLCNASPSQGRSGKRV